MAAAAAEIDDRYLREPERQAPMTARPEQLLLWIERDVSGLLPARRLREYAAVYQPLQGGLLMSVRRLAVSSRVGVTLWPSGFAPHMERGYLAASERSLAAGLEGELEKHGVDYAIIGCCTEGAGVSISSE
ncbi:MAG: hypothetical protein Q4B96_02415 [Bacillota bacterium]|nr:hypothetical protein [Bacillota bacterium]